MALSDRLHTITGTPPPAHSFIERRQKKLFALEERRGLKLMIWGRTIALVVIACLLPFLTPPSILPFYLGMLFVFAVTGWLMLWLNGTGRYRDWHSYAFFAFDVMLLTVTLLSPYPPSPWGAPPQLSFRFGNHQYYFVFLLGLAFTYRPMLVVLGGIFAALAWLFGIMAMLKLPSTTLMMDTPRNLTEMMQFYADPAYIDLEARLQEIIIFLIVTGLLSLVVLRSRRLVFKQARLERERSNLARYFPTETVDLISRTDSALTVEREQAATVLFADIVGFSTIAEQASPQEVIGLLRDVHGIIEQQVFAHGGAVDKFIGDGAMATFGTLRPSPEDPANALSCATAIFAEMDRYNETRIERSLSPVRLSLGLHHGLVVIGDIGTERRLELAVLGDTVNVASRLENMTREIGCRAIISDDVISRLPENPGNNGAEQLTRYGPVTIRGRSEDLIIWTL